MVLAKEGLYRNKTEGISIPGSSTDLQFRLCVIAHFGTNGHRGEISTADTIIKHFSWFIISADLQTFVKSSMHCLSTTGGEKVPRPFGPAVHENSSSDLLQFSYIEIAATATSDK